MKLLAKQGSKQQNQTSGLIVVSKQRIKFCFLFRLSSSLHSHKGAHVSHRRNKREAHTEGDHRLLTHVSFPHAEAFQGACDTLLTR